MVFVFNDGKVVLRPVKTGIQNDKLIEIKDGLQVGDEVVSAPFSAITRTLKNNTGVKKVAKDELFETKPE
jgi:HlyD family secretion protein